LVARSHIADVLHSPHINTIKAKATGRKRGREKRDAGESGASSQR